MVIFAPVLVLAAAHYVTGYDSVDGDEIRWGGTTKYSSQWSFAVSEWNGEGLINIAPDTLLTYEDLTISDTSKPLLSWYGSYDKKSRIYFNTYYMDKVTSSKKKHVTTHELGHALGLGHSVSGNVMYDSTWIYYLGSQDISDYQYLWGS